MKHEKFIYHSYKVTEDGFEYHFSMGEHEFRPKWTCSLPDLRSMAQDELFCEYLFNLGMVELISYWKSACPPIVEIRCGNLDEWQINWWKKLYRNGLGEFFYVNSITPGDDFMTILPARSVPTPSTLTVRKSAGCLIPVGGGKDSIVTLELLRESMGDNFCYIIGDVKRARDSAKTAGYSDSQILQVMRKIDPTLLELNKGGALNGHTPFSAIVAFSSLIFAYLSGKKYIVLSNESSANEGNVSGSDVNHQYSKSTEFERDFREYTSRLGGGYSADYFSLLRPWNELQITRAFTQFPQYFPVFQSCNVGTKTNTWCCNCAKCLYVYVMLSAFTDSKTLRDIFGEDLLDFSKRPELAAVLEALVNPELDKPFECVGTREEIRLALALKSGKNVILPEFWDDENFVPEKFQKLLKTFSEKSVDKAKKV
jgi:hypothetical protein